MAAFKEALEDLRLDRPPRSDVSQWEANRAILEALDLEGYSKFLRRREPSPAPRDVAPE